MRPQPRPPDPGPSLEACAGVVLGGTVTYFGVEAMLPGPLHPVHWGVTLGGAVIGYLIGQTVHRFKTGDTPWRRTPGRR